MQVFPLYEGTFTVDSFKTFIPFQSSAHKLEDRPASLLVDIVPFLIQTKNELIVVDPGLGFPDNVSTGNGFQIQNNIRHHGFSSEDVTLVLLSHLHKDHAGGVCYNKEGQYHLMFPSAKYYCQEKEMEYAFTKTESPSYIFDRLKFLHNSKQLNYLDGNGNIGSEIRCEVSGGHTPYHQVFHFESGNEKYFFGGDVLPQPSQVIRKFVAKYDFDGGKSAEKRREYATRAAQENWTCLFFHDGKTPMAKVKKGSGHFTVHAVEK